LRFCTSVDVVAHFVGMTCEMVDSRYGHHCPDHQATAANARADERTKAGPMREFLCAYLCARQNSGSGHSR